MSSKEFDIGRFRDGCECKKWLRSFQLFADFKGLLIEHGKDDSKVLQRYSDNNITALLHFVEPYVRDIFDVLSETGSAKE